MAASLPSMAVSSHRGWAWYLLITVQWLSLLTKAFRWDISAVSSCSFEKRFVNCHFEPNIQRILTTTWHLRQITSPVFTHPVVSEPCPLCSEAIHSSYTKWKPTCFESMTCWPFSKSLDIVKTSNFDKSCCKKIWSPAGLRYLGSAVALLHLSSHWLPGDREFRALWLQTGKLVSLSELHHMASAMLVKLALHCLNQYLLETILESSCRLFEKWLLVQENALGITESIRTWWRHQMETFSALLAFCEGNSRVTREFSHGDVTVMIMTKTCVT